MEHFLCDDVGGKHNVCGVGKNGSKIKECCIFESTSHFLKPLQ